MKIETGPNPSRTHSRGTRFYARDPKTGIRRHGDTPEAAARTLKAAIREQTRLRLLRTEPGQPPKQFLAIEGPDGWGYHTAKTGEKRGDIPPVIDPAPGRVATVDGVRWEFL